MVHGNNLKLNLHSYSFTFSKNSLRRARLTRSLARAQLSPPFVFLKFEELLLIEAEDSFAYKIYSRSSHLTFPSSFYKQKCAYSNKKKASEFGRTGARSYERKQKLILMIFVGLHSLASPHRKSPARTHAFIT